MILTDDEIRKAAEFAAEQMWPESGYVGWTEDDAVFHRSFSKHASINLRWGGGAKTSCQAVRRAWANSRGSRLHTPPTPSLRSSTAAGCEGAGYRGMCG